MGEENDICLLLLPEHHESEGEIVHQHIKSLVLFTEELPHPSALRKEAQVSTYVWHGNILTPALKGCKHKCGMILIIFLL